MAPGPLWTRATRRRVMQQGRGQAVPLPEAPLPNRRVRALCPRCVKSRLFSTTGSHGSQDPEFCTPCCFELIMHTSVGGWFSGGVPGINNVIIGAVPTQCENAPRVRGKGMGGTRCCLALQRESMEPTTIELCDALTEASQVLLG